MRKERKEEEEEKKMTRAGFEPRTDSFYGDVGGVVLFEESQVRLVFLFIF